MRIQAWWRPRRSLKHKGVDKQTSQTLELSDSSAVRAAVDALMHDLDGSLLSSLPQRPPPPPAAPQPPPLPEPRSRRSRAAAAATAAAAVGSAGTATTTVAAAAFSGRAAC